MKKTKVVFLLFGILIFLFGCKVTDVNNSDSNFTEIDSSINLYAFIGKKISVTQFDPNENNDRIEIDSITGDTIIHKSRVMDLGFKAKYQVLANVFNQLDSDTIDFVAYNHYGRPFFENHKNVLLYISFHEERGIYYHQKYQFDPLKINSKGIWKGLDGQSIEKIFDKKKKGTFKTWGIF